MNKCMYVPGIYLPIWGRFTLLALSGFKIEFDDESAVRVALMPPRLGELGRPAMTLIDNFRSFGVKPDRTYE